MPTADPLQPPEGWYCRPRPRLQPPPLKGRGPLFRALLRLTLRMGRRERPTIFPVLNIHRSLFPAWLWFASRLMPYGKLPAPVRELLILRTAWNCRCRYEWGQHVELGLRAGLTDADILASTRGADVFSDPRRQDLIRACDELCGRDCLSDRSWQALQGNWHEAELIELMILVGHYRMLAGFLNSAGLLLEAPIEAIVQAFWSRTADTR